MAITSAIVLFGITWFMVLFVTLPLRRRTQGDEGEIVPGTHAGAPVNFDPRRTVKIVTLVSIPIWLIIVGVILSGVISIDDFQGLNRMTIEPSGGTGG